MTPTEVDLIIESQRVKTVDGIPEDDYFNMIDRMEELERQGHKVM